MKLVGSKLPGSIVRFLGIQMYVSGHQGKNMLD